VDVASRGPCFCVSAEIRVRPTGSVRVTVAFGTGVAAVQWEILRTATRWVHIVGRSVWLKAAIISAKQRVAVTRCLTSYIQKHQLCKL